MGDNEVRTARWQAMTTGLVLSAIVMVYGMISAFFFDTLIGIILFVAGLLGYYINGLTSMVCSLVDRIEDKD